MASGTDRAERNSKSLANRADMRRWFTQTPPWLASLAIHLVVLGALAGVSITAHVTSRPVIIETRLDLDDIAPPEFTPTLSELPVDSSINDSTSFTKAGASVGQQLGTPSFTTGTASGIGIGSGRGSVAD